MDQLNQCENEIRVTELFGSIKIVKYRCKSYFRKIKDCLPSATFFYWFKSVD